MGPWIIGWLLACLLLISVDARADERWHGNERWGFPFSSEHWEGSRKWTPDHQQRRHWDWPDRFTIDKRGKCEVRCERSGRSYRCKEYRC